MDNNLFESILDNNNIKVYLFIENTQEFICINRIKINIYEDRYGYSISCFKTIDIECELYENNIESALRSLKYYKLMYENEHSRNPKTGRLEIHKKNISSDVILYVSKDEDSELNKILGLKNVVIINTNEFERTITLTCDHYIMFEGIQGIDDEQYISNINKRISINYNQSCNSPYFIDSSYYYENKNSLENIEDDYGEDDYDEDNWDFGWDDYNENSKQQHSLLESFKKSLSKINCFKL